MRRLDRVRLWATPVLLLILAGLVIAYLFKAGVVTRAWFETNKDLLDALNSLIASVVLVVAGVLGYYKFLRGRTFTTRASMEITVGIIEGPQGSLLHCLTVLIKNIGTVSILEPRLVVRVEKRRAESDAVDEISDWFEASDSTRTAGRRFGVIDSGETAEFVAERFFEPAVWAVTYSAVLTCTSGDTWAKRVTVSNAREPGASSAARSEGGAETGS